MVSPNVQIEGRAAFGATRSNAGVGVTRIGIAWQPCWLVRNNHVVNGATQAEGCHRAVAETHHELCVFPIDP